MVREVRWQAHIWLGCTDIRSRIRMVPQVPAGGGCLVLDLSLRRQTCISNTLPHVVRRLNLVE